jgi:NADH dehydrogenase
MRRPPIPGAESVYSIDTLAEAVLFDRHLKQIARATSAPAIAVIGAGFTGLELALELRDRLQVHGGDAVSKNARIHLIERADAPGPELGDGPRGAIEAAIHDARIQLHLGTRVTALGPQRVVFGEGDIETDAVVLTTGMVAADFANSIAGAHDNLGRVIVDRELRARAQPHVFVAGDSAAADVGDGHLALQSCQHAMQMGRVAGENAARELLGQPLLPYSQLRYVTCLDLGRSGAVLTQGWDRSVVSVGESAKNTKRWINQTAIYPPKDASPETLIASSKIEQR